MTSTRYTIPTRAVDVFEKTDRVYASGLGDKANFVEVSRGWFVLLEGSWEALYLGPEKPGLVAGDKVKITLEKVD